MSPQHHDSVSIRIRRKDLARINDWCVADDRSRVDMMSLLCDIYENHRKKKAGRSETGEPIKVEGKVLGKWLQDNL